MLKNQQQGTLELIFKLKITNILWRVSMPITLFKNNFAIAIIQQGSNGIRLHGQNDEHFTAHTFRADSH